MLRAEDRQEVEGAIARCFLLARFEEAFREDGTARPHHGPHQGAAGLLRVQDLFLALGIVWTLNAFDS